jgi:hypothetical protein
MNWEVTSFSINNPPPTEIDRVFTGKNQSWVVYVDGEREVTRKIEIIQKAGILV